MSLKSVISMTTRASDLDSRRHVNNRTYEQLCAEGRLRLLEEQGYPVEVLLSKGISLRPMSSFVRFALQQMAGATLIIQTEAFPSDAGVILWNHHIRQSDGKNVCQLQARSETLDDQYRPMDLLPAANEEPVQIHIEQVPDFSGNCERVSSSYSVIYTDLDVFGELPFAAYWRIFEEARHMFGEQLGLTPERLFQLDTNIFWVAGTYQYAKTIQAGQRVRIYTWLERVVRIRAYIRQEIWTADGAELLGASREEHMTVSMSKGRVRGMPAEMQRMLAPYLEFQG
jgi:acyl-CoA thioesterase FadM